jgi:hypothetical protein
LAHAASRVVDRADLAVKPLLTVHIAAALGLFGVSTVLLVGSLHAATRDDPQDAHATYTLLRLLTFSVDIPLASITLLAGPGARPNLEVADLPLPVGPSEAGPLHRDPNGRRNPDRPEHRHHARRHRSRQPQRQQHSMGARLSGGSTGHDAAHGRNTGSVQAWRTSALASVSSRDESLASKPSRSQDRRFMHRKETLT